VTISHFLEAQLWARAFGASQPAPHRSMVQFAEEELILTTGPRRGLRFRADFMPWTRLVLEEFDHGRFRRFFLSGSVQSGKTLVGFVLPTMYHLFEIGESVIIGVPKIDLAQGIYEERILPSIQVSRYAELVPTRGPGSRGGKITSAIRFGNGATLRFMGAGGGDAQRSSFTARVVVLTEIDKMDEPGKASREADPVTQIEARTRAFGDRARVYAECTMSTEYGRIYREVSEYGTDTRIVFRCPKCRRPVALEREGFGGWQEAADLPAAREGAYYACPSCGAHWAEGDRQAALREPALLSRGQAVEPETGEITGAPPATDTFGLRWTALASGLLTMADIAEAEYRAERSASVEDQKALAQFTWALPFREEILDVARPRMETILQKMTQIERGVIPEGTEKLTLAIDVGSYVIWWALVAWRGEALGHVVDFGSVKVPLIEDARNPKAVMDALRAFREEVLVPGWGGRRPDLVVVDSGYEQEVVYRWVVESGQGRYLACRGFGTSSRHGMWHAGAQSSPTRQMGNEWRISLQASGIRLLEIHADPWKTAVHEGFAAAHGAPGSITVYRGNANDQGMRDFARQIVAEQREADPAAKDKELKIRWVVLSKRNHFLDCMAYARAAADLLGIRLVRIKRPEKKAAPPPAKPEVVSEKAKIRTSY